MSQASRNSIGAAGLACLMAAILFAPDRAAADYPRARQLVLRADALFQLHRDNDALALLGQALTMQSQQNKEFGYARYVHFRRARYLLSEGKRDKARDALILALKVSAGQQQIAPRYRVSRHHPFIVKNFPRLAGVSTKRQPAHEILPRADALLAGNGPYLYGIGKTFVERIDRTRRTLLTIHEQPDDEIARFAVGPKNERTVLAYRRSGDLHFIFFDPLSERRVAAPAVPERLHIDAQGTAVVFARDAKQNLNVYRVPSTATDTSKLAPVLTVSGEALYSSAQRLVYAEYAPGTRAAAGQASYQRVSAYDLARGKRDALFTFGKPDARSALFAVTSPGGGRVALLARDAGSNRRALVVYQFASGERDEHNHTVLLRPEDGPAAAFSHKADYLVLLEQRAGKLRVIRFDYRKGQQQLIGTLPLRNSREADQVHGLGVLKDNRTVWIHRGGELVLMDLAGRSRTSALTPFAHAKRAQWAGESLYFAEPEQFVVGLAKDGHRAYVLIPRQKLSSP